MNRSPPPSSNPLARSNPIASIKRDSVELDPLFDRESKVAQGQSTAADAADSPNSPLSPMRSSQAVDPVEALADEFLKNCSVRTASSYSGVELSNPLVELARCSKWNQVVSLSSPLSLSGLTEDTVTTLAYRFEALFRLRQYDELLGELSSVQQAVGSAQDKLDLRCSLVLLQCEAQLLCGRSSDALCALQSLHTELESREGGEGGRVLFWRLQCLSQRANALVRLRQWRGAVCLARDLSLLVLREAHQLPKGEQGVVAGLQASLLLHLSKLLLQIGAARASAAHFEKAGHLLAAHPSLSFSHPWLRRESEVVRGLLLFSQERVEDALDCFASILAACQKDATDPSAQAPGPSPAGPLSGLLQRVAGREGGVASAANNLAVCALYLKRNAVAIAQLEGLLRSGPAQHMCDAVVFNLCTLYDLAWSPEQSQLKKKALQRVAQRLQIHESDLNWRSFRLS